MGRHSIPGPDDAPREPFVANPPPDESRRPRDRWSFPLPSDEEPEPSAAPPPGREPARGRFVGGAWQGGHRSTETKRRGVSIGVIVALIAVVLVLSAIIL